MLKLLVLVKRKTPLACEKVPFVTKPLPVNSVKVSLTRVEWFFEPLSASLLIFQSIVVMTTNPKIWFKSLFDMLIVRISFKTREFEDL